MKPDWILIANASRARLLQRRAGELTLVQSFEHPESRRKASDLGDARAGHELGARGIAGTAYYPRMDAKDKEKVRFAREIAEQVEHAARRNAFRSLSVFASSPFLGELKRELGDATATLLAGAHDVDLTSVGMAELPRRIQDEARS